MPDLRIPEDHPAVEELAKRRHEREHAAGFDDRPWDRLPGFTRDKIRGAAREDINDLWPLLCGELEVERDRLREQVALKMDDRNADALRAEAEATEKRAEKAEQELEQARAHAQEQRVEKVQARQKLAEVRAEVERAHAILRDIATRPTVERNPDGDDQAAATMQLLAREYLDSAPSVAGDYGVGERLRHPNGSEWELIKHIGGEQDDWRARCVKPHPGGGSVGGFERTFHREYMDRTFKRDLGPLSCGACGGTDPSCTVCHGISTQQLPGKSLSREPGDRADAFALSKYGAGFDAFDQAMLKDWAELLLAMEADGWRIVMPAALTQQSTDPEVGEGAANSSGVGVAIQRLQAEYDRLWAKATGLYAKHSPYADVVQGEANSLKSAIEFLTQPEADPEVPRCEGTGVVLEMRGGVDGAVEVDRDCPGCPECRLQSFIAELRASAGEYQRKRAKTKQAEHDDRASGNEDDLRCYLYADGSPTAEEDLERRLIAAGQAHQQARVGAASTRPPSQADDGPTEQDRQRLLDYAMRLADGYKLEFGPEDAYLFRRAACVPPQAEVQDCAFCNNTRGVEWTFGNPSPKVPCPACVTDKQSPEELQDCRVSVPADVLTRLLQHEDTPVDVRVAREAFGDAREAPAELQGDVVEAAARWLFEKYGPEDQRAWQGWRGLGAVQKDKWRCIARDLLAAITPLLPGSNYALELRERLEGPIHTLASTIGRARLHLREPVEADKAAGELRDAAEAMGDLRAALNRKDSDA